MVTNIISIVDIPIKRLAVLRYLTGVILTCFFYPATAQTLTYPFPLQHNEQLTSIAQMDGKYIAFIVAYDTRLKFTSLKATQYNPQNQQKLQEQTIDSARIGIWQNHPVKGKVRQSFENAVLSGRRNEGQAPLEYQYQVRYAPDSKIILCYRYDYSQLVLHIETITLKVGTSLQVMERASLPVDEGITNHGLYINTAGVIFILNTNEQDGIELMRYQPENAEVALLELSASSTRRNNFKIAFITGERLYVAGMAENSTGLTGVMCALFDFKASRVENVWFFPVSKTMLEAIQQKPGKGKYSLILFKPEKDRFIFELEKRSIAASDYTYDSYAVNDLQQWKPRKMQVQTGENLLLEFNIEGKLISEKISDAIETY